MQQKLRFNLSVLLLMNLLFLTKQSCAYSVPDYEYDYDTNTNTNTSATTDSKIDPELLQQLQNGANATIFLEFRDSVQTVFDSFENRQFATREERLTALNEALTSFINTSQNDVVDFLNGEPAARGVTYESFYITNLIIVRNGDLKLAKELAKFDEISKLTPDGIAMIG